MERQTLLDITLRYISQIVQTPHMFSCMFLLMLTSHVLRKLGASVSYLYVDLLRALLIGWVNLYIDFAVLMCLFT